MLRAVAGDPPGPDLAAVGDELSQQPGVLVIHVGDLLLAEQADFLPGLAYWCFRHHGAPGESPAPGGDGQLLGVWGSVSGGAQKGGSSDDPPSPSPPGSEE